MDIMDQVIGKRLDLRAGPLSMVFEPQTAFLRYVRFGTREVLRGVYCAVRTEGWKTVAPRIGELRADIEERRFRLRFMAEHRDGAVDFRWAGELSGDETGRVEYRMDGKAHASFLRNRIGLCVLHPIRECAGQPCRIETSGGAVADARFPGLIAPHQPFLDMRAISHEILPGIRAEIRFEGDIFETEDQRNWTDASFKTYSTPLALPFPVRLNPGDAVVQSVTLQLSGDVPEAGETRDGDAISLEVRGPGEAVKLPPIGLQLTDADTRMTAAQRDRLAALRPSHFRIDLDLSSPGYGEPLQRAAAFALETGAALEIAAFVSDAFEGELQAFARELAKVKPPVARCLVFHGQAAVTPDACVRRAKQLLPGPVGGGTNSDFVELNRARPGQPGDIVSYSVCPQVHQFDDATLVENLAGMRDTVRTARGFIGTAAVAVSPVALHARTGGSRSPSDPRQTTLFGACWTLGALQALAESGADSLTFYEVTGPRGIMAGATGAGGAETDIVCPAFHVLADAAEFAGGDVLPLAGGDPLRIAGIALRKGNRRRIMLANFAGEQSRVLLTGGFLKDPVHVRSLDETSAELAGREPEEYRRRDGTAAATGSAAELTLPPRGYVRVDMEGGSE